MSNQRSAGGAPGLGPRSADGRAVHGSTSRRGDPATIPGGTRASSPAVRRTALFASLTIAATLTIVACDNPTPPSAPSVPPAPRTEVAAPTDGTATPGRAAVSPAPGPGATPPTPSGADALAAASCAKDSDCAWDDPCVPRRCVAAAASPPAVGCDKSVPPEGTCVCFDRRCAYRPDATRSPVSVEAACTSRQGCIMDVAAGTCVPGDDPEAHPPGLPGPRCRCDSREPRRCHYDWIEPVPCASDDDCWVSDESSTPIARPRKLRGKRFRPCKDGELAPVCQSGTCAVRALSC
jgi:hypothetical protein